MIPRLHVVTDDAILAREDFLDQAGQILASGVGVALHLRGPHTSGRRMYDLAVALRGISEASGAMVLVNDRVDVALCSGLQGVHLGARSLAPGEARRLLGPSRLVGVSVHGVEEAKEAGEGEADFLFAGSIWTTTSHPDQAAVGPSLIREVTGAVATPVLGIGGVTPDRVSALLEVGAHGAAVLGGIWRAPSSGEAAQAYLQALSM